MFQNLEKIDTDLIRRQSHLDCKCRHCGANYLNLKAVTSDRVACSLCGKTSAYIYKPRKRQRQFTVAEDLNDLLDLEINASGIVDTALRKYYKLPEKKY
jgi:hypothetical protein